MKKDEVKVGSTYAMKVSNQIVPVRVTEERWTGDKHTGWIGLNTTTKRPVRIKSAQKLRHEVGAPPLNHSEQIDPEPTPPRPPATPGALQMPGESGVADAVGVAGPDAGAAGKGRKGKGGGRGSKKAKEAKAPASPKEKLKKLSGLDAAAQVLKKAGKPMNFKDIADGALALGWKTSGKTPQATLYAAAIREIAAKGKQARFKKTERGMFEHSGVEAE